MKRTATGYRVNRNGKPILNLEPNEILTDKDQGMSFKSNGEYFFYVGRRGAKHLYAS